MKVFESFKSKIKQLYHTQKPIEVEKNKSAFKDFVNEHQIKGQTGFGPEEFLKLVKPSVIVLLDKE